MSEPLSVQRIFEILQTVDDPEIGINIVDLGFIYEVRSEPETIFIQMALTSTACPMRDTILDWIRNALAEETPQEVVIDTDSAPAWTPHRINARVLDPGAE